MQLLFCISFETSEEICTEHKVLQRSVGLNEFVLQWWILDFSEERQPQGGAILLSVQNCPKIDKSEIITWLNFLNFIQLLPSAKEVWGKVMFLQVFLYPPLGGRWLSSMHHQGGLHPRGLATGGGWADPPRDTWDTTECSQQAVGTHGMHSCTRIIFIFELFKEILQV